MSSISKLRVQLDAAESEYEKFQKGNKAAGTRSRSALMEIIKAAKELRVKIQDAKNG